MWTINCQKDLTIRNERGEEVHFRTRHERALIGLLSVAPENEMSRARLGALLWPGRDDYRMQQSLRRAIANVKSVMGEDGPLIVDRVKCQLASDRCHVDTTDECQEKLLRRLLGDDVADFAPELMVLRKGVVAPENHWRTSTEAATSLFDALDWMAPRQPLTALEMLYSALNLAEFAPSDRLHRLLNSLNSSLDIHDHRIGYVHFLRAISAIYGNAMTEAERWLRVTLTHAAGVGMPDLAADVQFYRVALMLMYGEPEKGLRLANEAEKALASACEAPAACRLRHGRALAELHNGRFDEGLRTMQETYDAAELGGARLEKAYVLANWAWFESTVGNKERAIALAHELETSEESLSYRIWLTKELALASAEMPHAPQSARSRLKMIEEICDRLSQFTFQIYRLELSAQLSVFDGRLIEARRELSEANRIRLSGRMSWTEWDIARIRPVSRAIKAEYPEPLPGCKTLMRAETQTLQEMAHSVMP
ncbi:MAG: hypothetical protein KF812_12295 [Fimbriimonadaceae bacterium]|nr:hypothetical protein [Fimbriimonadaceae bacterium]